MNYLDEIKSYIPKNDQEFLDLQQIREFVERYGDDSLSGKNLIAHITASAWIVNKDRTKVLINYNNISEECSWILADANGNPNLADVILKEINGLLNVKLLDERAIMINVIPTVKNTNKDTFYSHLHLNFTYLIEASLFDNFKITDDGNSGLKWINLDDAEYITKDIFLRTIYKKLVEYTKSLKN